MQSSTSIVVRFRQRTDSREDRCVHCGAPLVEVPDLAARTVIEFFREHGG